MFFLPLPLVTDPFPLFKSISHSCTVPSSAVILKRKLPFIFFTIELPSCQGKERESSRITGGLDSPFLSLPVLHQRRLSTSLFHHWLLLVLLYYHCYSYKNILLMQPGSLNSSTQLLLVGTLDQIFFEGF